MGTHVILKVWSLVPNLLSLNLLWDRVAVKNIGHNLFNSIQFNYLFELFHFAQSNMYCFQVIYGMNKLFLQSICSINYSRYRFRGNLKTINIIIYYIIICRTTSSPKLKFPARTANVGCGFLQKPHLEN